MFVVMLAGVEVFAAGQNSPAQDPSDATTQNPPAQGTPSGNSGNSGSGTVRTAPAAALSGIAGMSSEDAGDTNSSLPVIPALLGGVGISSSFLSEMERSNYLRGGVNVGATYDDNPLLATSGGTSNTSVSIFPNLSIEESTPRARWTLGYAGGLTINQSLASQDQQSHSLNFDSQYRLTQHVNLRVAEKFFMTTGFFDSGTGAGSIGSGGPNPSLITPLATQRSSTTTVETNYHFALNDLVGGSGSFYDMGFSNVPAGAQLANSNTASGSAFWLHQLFRGDWGGASYRFDRISFNPGNGASVIHSFFAIDTLSLSNHFTVSGFIGPQYSQNTGLVPLASQPSQFDEWSIAGGFDGGWQDQRTSLNGGYSRSISDGGGVLGAVFLQNIHASFRRELIPGWAAALTVLHGANRAILVTAPGSASSINLTTAGVSLERNVGKSVGFRLGYTHDFQQQFDVPGTSPTSPLTTLDASRNRFFVTLSYQWAKPLGM